MVLGEVARLPGGGRLDVHRVNGDEILLFESARWGGSGSVVSQLVKETGCCQPYLISSLARVSSIQGSQLSNGRRLRSRPEVLCPSTGAMPVFASFVAFTA